MAMTKYGEPVHAERVVEDDASELTALTIYPSGSVTARSLGANEFFHVTDISIILEAGGDFSLVADEAAAGKYIRHGNVAANGGVEAHLITPYACPKGLVPKFVGPATGRSVCLVEGFISQG